MTSTSRRIRLPQAVTALPAGGHRFLGFVPFEVGETLGEKIVACCKIRGVPRSELADRLGVDPNTLWRWEAGETRPHLSALEKLERLLTLPPRPSERER